MAGDHPYVFPHLHPRESVFVLAKAAMSSEGMLWYIPLPSVLQVLCNSQSHRFWVSQPRIEQFRHVDSSHEAILDF